MSSRIRTITFDCHDHENLGRFWTEVLGYVDDPKYPNSPGDPEWVVADPAGLSPHLLFLPVPEGKTVKNRVHLDLTPATTRDEEVARLEALGATVYEDHRKPDGTGFVTMADPEGNEFCVERSLAEKGEAPVASPPWRPQPSVRAGDEQELIVGLLDWYRDGVLAKVDGCSDFEAHAKPGPSETSIAGIVNHLALVEDSWFSERFAGEEPIDLWADVDWETDPDFEFRTARDLPLATAVARYQAAVERSRSIIDAYELDDISRHDPKGPINLRWCITHMLEETARHLGHLDMLRELLSGTTGG